ncbi:MAG: glycosyltransferase family 8 protein [Patescibacteria group bacterium]
MKKEKSAIPIVFTFDDNYALPAAVAIKSLIHTGKRGTWYDIYCLYQNLSDQNRRALNQVAKINWIKVNESLFTGAPTSVEYPVDVYYRLAIHDILPQYDKIIYSDVDVLFQGDLTAVYKMNMEGAYWAGVPLEKNEVPSLKAVSAQIGNPDDAKFMSGHTKFAENSNANIFANGFMVINVKKMREDRMTEKFLQTIKQFSGRLKMFDLEVLNLACQNGTIKSLPFEYCVLEDIAIAKDYRKTNLYPFLSRVFSDKELTHAVRKPVILHYTGANTVRVWHRDEKIQPSPYKFFFSMVAVLL